MIQNTSKAGKIGGKISGKKNVESGHMAKINKMGGVAAASIVRICPHCGKEGKGPSYFRFHGDKCKMKA